MPVAIPHPASARFISDPAIIVANTGTFPCPRKAPSSSLLRNAKNMLIAPNAAESTTNALPIKTMMAAIVTPADLFTIHLRRN
jgi:hypothetical protein